MRRRFLSRASVGVLAACALAITSGCGGGGDSKGTTGNQDTGTPVAGGTVNMRLWSEVNSFDPQRANTSAGYQIAEFLYDRLVTLKGGVVTSGLATKWDVSPKQIVFTISPDPTCADGTKVTPSVIKASFERVIDPATRNPVASDYLGDGVKFSADDEAGTFTVTVPKPSSDLLIYLTEPSFAVICPAGLASPDKLQSEAFGSGPFVLTKAVRGAEYDFAPRDGYTWAPGGGTPTGLPDEIRMQVVANETTATNLFVSGGLDVMEADKADSVKRLAGTNSIQKDSPIGLAFVMFNAGDGHPTADESVRRAVAELIDPEAYTAAAQGGLGATSTGDLFPPETPCAGTDGASLRPPMSVDDATATLDSAGWTKTDSGWEKDGTPLKLVIHSHTDVGLSGDFVAQTLKDFGIQVDVKVVSVDQYVDDASENDWDVYAGSLAAPPTPSVLGVVFGGGLDWGSIRDPGFIDQVERARTSGSPEETCKHWQQAQNILFDHVYVVPETWLNSTFFSHDVDFEIWTTSGIIEPTTIHRVAS